MDTEIKRENDGARRKVDNRAGQGAKDTNTTAATAGGTAGGTSGGTTAGTTAGTTGTAEEKKFSKVATVSTEPQTLPQPKKPKQKRKKPIKAKQDNATFNAEQITALILTASEILKNSDSGKIFALSESEAAQIAKPLANILANAEAFKGLNEHSDSIALATACFMIFVPKLFIYFQYIKMKKAEKKQQIKIVKGVQPNDRETKEATDSNRQADRTATNNRKNGDTSLYEQLPSITW